MSRYFSSQMLTVAIVASVVFINSVAWGIPLLVKASQSEPRLAASNITTGAVSRPSRFVEQHPKLPVRNIALDLDRAPIPLPAKAPVRKDLRTLLESREPTTLFPRPQAAPDLLTTSPTVTARGNRNLPVRGHQPQRQAARDIVLVSPYTPGVRIAPNGRTREWRHRNLRSSAGPTTLDKARAIARRAAQRFEQMRDRMAKLNTRDAAATHKQRARGLALLPVAPRPPRIVTGSVSRSATKSAHNYVRPRLVRRPIGEHVTRLPRNFSPAVVMSVAPALAVAARDVGWTAQPGEGVSKPQRVARLTTGVPKRAQSRRPRSRVLRSRSRSARSSWRRAKRHRVARARNARRTSQRNRRSGRKINGFRRGFHRQLVAANFFGTQY